MSIVQVQSAFYENQREQNNLLRETSNILFARNFNNWVKSLLINQACQCRGNNLSVLDIC